MKALRPLALALLTALPAGCVTGNSRWVGLVPGKDVQVDELTDRIVTPWGHREFVARGLRTRVNPKGDSPLLVATNSLPYVATDAGEPVLPGLPARGIGLQVPSNGIYLLVPVTALDRLPAAR